jgi:hypothetical protein
MTSYILDDPKYSSMQEAYNKAHEFAPQISAKNQVLDIHLKEYLDKPVSWKKCYKGYRISINFPPQPIPMNPYLLGYWLGDGTSSKAQITTIELEVVD